jgi:hypothetical protein
MKKLVILGMALALSGCSSMTPEQREGIHRFGVAMSAAGDAMRRSSPSRREREMTCKPTFGRPDSITCEED